MGLHRLLSRVDLLQEAETPGSLLAAEFPTPGAHWILSREL